MAGLYYEIRVAGTLPDEALVDFERITADVEPVETVLHGPLADQAALHGLLARLEMFGAEVLEVRRLKSRAAPDSLARGLEFRMRSPLPGTLSPSAGSAASSPAGDAAAVRRLRS